MKVVILALDRKEGSRLQGCLREAGLDVRITLDAPALLHALGESSAELGLICVEQASDSICDVIGQLRERLLPEPAQIHLVADRMPEAVAIAAYKAGLDGELVRGASMAYLLARVQGIRRTLARTKRRDVVEVVSVPAEPVTPAAAFERLTRGSTWRDASKKLRDVASQFLTLPAVTGAAPPANSHLSLGCGILLSSVEHQVELRVAVGTDSDSAGKLAVHLFGPESAELGPDVLSELANIFMGALKSSYGAEAVPVTGGLPSVLDPAHVQRPVEVFAAQETFTLSLADAKIVVHLGARSKANVPVEPFGLREGMILAKDVFNVRGLLLVQKGTRLSVNMIEKLRNLLPSKTQVEVMVA